MKHGFLFPEDIVESNYDVSFGSKSSDIISIDELKQQIINKKLANYEELVVLGGKSTKGSLSKPLEVVMVIRMP
ncbi:hypothetical protein [Domibacillus indicus]|uniref:hypothetical protein n=1 Tax=Domibacillus indicus TaxID=1437523 RepID=UPI0037BF2C00